MQRLREIEALTAEHERRLAEAREELGPGPAWQEAVERWDFGVVNDLIDRHNRYYPAESRLPMDPRTGDFVLVNGRPYRRTPLDAAWAFDRFRSVKFATLPGVLGLVSVFAEPPDPFVNWQGRWNSWQPEP